MASHNVQVNFRNHTDVWKYIYITLCGYWSTKMYMLACFTIVDKKKNLFYNKYNFPYYNSLSIVLM